MTEQPKSSDTADGAALSSEHLANLAHELRSPLGGIEAMIALLGETRAASDQERLIEGLKAASAHLRAVANALLQPKAPTASSVTVGDALKMFAVAAASRAAGRGLTFRQEMDPASASAIVADGTALRQILENLVDNAVRHAAEGAVSLKVGLSDALLRFEVVNCGKGIAPLDAGRMFARTSSPDARPDGGGLGLNIVAELVGRQGGHCGAEALSEPAGTRVWFTLPVIGHAKAEPREIPTVTPVARLLVVEDDATNRLLLKTVLEHMGYAVDTTGSPTEALGLIQTGYAGLFTDMTMPEMDGWTLIRAIRAKGGAYARLPIIGVTGRVAPEETARVIEAGGNWVVEKPVTIHDLRQALMATGLSDPMARQVASAA